MVVMTRKCNCGRFVHKRYGPRMCTRCKALLKRIKESEQR